MAMRGYWNDDLGIGARYYVIRVTERTPFLSIGSCNNMRMEGQMHAL